MGPNTQTSQGSVDGVETTPTTIHKEPNDARQAEKTGRVRYILGISFFAAIVALAIVFFVLHGGQHPA